VESNKGNEKSSCRFTLCTAEKNWFYLAMAAPPEILDLVTRFQRQIDSYKSGDYNETRLRHPSRGLKPGADITPERAYADAAHFYGKEEPPPYRPH
jgi:hypothetical protein